MGLIQDQMQGEAQPAAEEPVEQPAGQPGAPSAESGNSESYDAAIEYAMTALYKQGGAKQLAQALRAAGDNPAQAMADAAYQMMQVIDEKTGGDIPDEELVPLATEVLTEVAEIAEAAGVNVEGSTIAAAMKTMLIRFVQEQGGDTTQLEQAMGQIDPAMFNQVAGDGEQQPQEA